MRQTYHGVVITAGLMAKTIKVRINVRAMHPIYKKILNNRRNYLVHDEGELCSVGDVVRIEACRPLSTRKHFCLAEILQKRNLGILQPEKEGKDQAKEQKGQNRR